MKTAVTVTASHGGKSDTLQFPRGFDLSNFKTLKIGNAVKEVSNPSSGKKAGRPFYQFRGLLGQLPEHTGGTLVNINSSGRVMFDFKRAAIRQHRRAQKHAARKRQTNVFLDTIENLQRIANAPEGTSRGGNRGPRRGESKKPTLRERILQKQARRYAEARGILVIQWDHNGNPDHLYLFSNNAVLGAVEFKDPGKKPRKDQARKILELLNRMPVAVISDFKSFKKWLNIRIREAA